MVELIIRLVLGAGTSRSDGVRPLGPTTRSAREVQVLVGGGGAGRLIATSSARGMRTRKARAALTNHEASCLVDGLGLPGGDLRAAMAAGATLVGDRHQRVWLTQTGDDQALSGSVPVRHRERTREFDRATFLPV